VAGEAYPAILEAVLAGIRELNLPSIPSSRVIRKTFPDPHQSTDDLPGVFVAASETGERVEPLSFENRLDVQYPVDVLIVGAQSPEPAGPEDLWLIIREQIRRKLQTPPLTGVLTVWSVEVSSLPPLPRDRQREGWIVSGLRFTFHNEETR
jgi:hypothetical protein